MQQKMKSTVIQLKNEQQISFYKVIIYTKFGYNALFRVIPIQGFQSCNQAKYYDVYAFSKSLLQINNLKNHIEQIIRLYSKLNNNKILCPILQRIDQKDMFYLVSQVQKYSLKQLIQKRQGLTEYQVTYFIMELFEILNYCKSRGIYFEKLELSNLYLNEDMKLALPFNMFLNKATSKPLMKRLPFRNQAKNRNNCPELFCNSASEKGNERQKSQNKGQPAQNKQVKHPFININLIDSWNMGILIYQLFQNSKPFQTNCATPIVSHNHSPDPHVTNDQVYNENQNKKYYKLRFYQIQSQQAKQLITKLLQIDQKKRLNFPLILIQPILKKFQQIPHILPSTILTCPPSQQFKQSYKQNFRKQKILVINSEQVNSNGQAVKPNYHRSLKKRHDTMKTQIITKSTSFNHVQMFSAVVQNNNNENIRTSALNQQTKPRRQSLAVDKILQVIPQGFTQVIQTQKYIKGQERSLTENKIYLQQFVDISHIYGFGYQMNTGTLCFVYNDETQFYFSNANRKYIVYVNQKKGQTTYSYDKLPQEQDLKKKIYILQAYSKSIKKFKTPSQQPSGSSNEKTVMVMRYGKTKHASLFYLSNESIQVFFNDKICFLMTSTNLYVLGKNNDKYQKYDYRNETNQMKTRRQYVTAMAKKVFGWKRDKILEDSESEEVQQIKQENKQVNRKNSILTGLQQDANHKLRLQSFKKIKEAQERNNRANRKLISPHQNDLEDDNQ